MFSWYFSRLTSGERGEESNKTLFCAFFPLVVCVLLAQEKFLNFFQDAFGLKF